MNEPYPLFIVGCPRSGTKLLRELLNNHPDISLGQEGHYIPLLVDQVGVGADPSQPEVWHKLFRAFQQTSYYRTSAQEGRTLSEATFMAALAERAKDHAPSWTDVFETLFRAYSPRQGARIWGDKSHGYISHAPLLRRLFPTVRFLYLVRDPRDQALSVQRTWGRNPLRSAQGWYSVAREAEQFGLLGGSDALTVRYEDLTADPSGELGRVCAFLGVPFVEAMTRLKRPAEKERNGQLLEHVTRQQAKYRQALPPEVVRHISEITLPYLATYGYDTEGATHHRPLTRQQLKKMSYLDGLASLRYHIKEKGVLGGLRYYGARRYESWSARSRRLRGAKG